MPMPEIFTDKAANLEFILSSSQTPATGTLGGGFSPIAKDGYGISYIVAEDRLWFHISAWRMSNTRYISLHKNSENDLFYSAEKFAEVLRQCLLEMHDVCLSVQSIRVIIYALYPSSYYIFIRRNLVIVNIAFKMQTSGLSLGGILCEKWCNTYISFKMHICQYIDKYVNANTYFTTIILLTTCHTQYVDYMEYSFPLKPVYKVIIR